LFYFFLFMMIVFRTFSYNLTGFLLLVKTVLDTCVIFLFVTLINR